MVPRTGRIVSLEPRRKILEGQATEMLRLRESIDDEARHHFAHSRIFLSLEHREKTRKDPLEQRDRCRWKRRRELMIDKPGLLLAVMR